MKQSIKHDVRKLININKWIICIGAGLENQNIQNVNDFKKNLFVQAACTQLITNIYQDKQILQKDTNQKLILLNQIKLETSRNIASHDYDNVDFNIIYAVCQKLLKDEIRYEIDTVIKAIENNTEDVNEDAAN